MKRFREKYHGIFHESLVFSSRYTHEPLGERVFSHVLSVASMKKYPDKTTFTSEVLFNVLTVLSTKIHCTMNNNF